MTSKTGKQIITIHILPNISRSKGNKIMKFGQFINVTWKIPFSKNYMQNVVENLVPDLLLKNQLFTISLDQQSEILSSLSLFYVQVESYQNILKLYAFNWYKDFLKNHIRSGNNLLASFSAWFLKKNISHLFLS